MINKKTVANNFSKSSKNYDKYAIIQKHMAKKLIEHLDEDSYGNILEIGCGTGILTDYILDKNLFSILDLCDISSEMLQKVKKKYKDKINSYILGDIEELELNQKYDLIISNASFQWFNNLEKTLEKLLKALNPGGLLLFSTFGEKTYRELEISFKILGEKYKYSQDFPKFSYFKNKGYKVYEEILEEEYKSLMDFFKAVKGVGASSAETDKKPITKNIIKKVEEEYLNLYGGKIKVTNHLLYVYVKNK